MSPSSFSSARPRAEVAVVNIPFPASRTVDLTPASERGTFDADRVVGTWVETWGEPGNSDVDYHDVYELRVENHRLVITCPEKPMYTFERVTFDGKRLFVRLENSGVVIKYALDYERAVRRFRGSAATSRGNNVPIVWELLGDAGTGEVPRAEEP